MDMRKYLSYIGKFIKTTKYVYQFKERTDTRLLTVPDISEHGIISFPSLLCFLSFLHRTPIILVNSVFIMYFFLRALDSFKLLNN